MINKMSILIFFILLLSCSDDNPNNGNKILTDTIGDTGISLVDIDNVELITTNTHIIVKLSLLSIPDTYIYNSVNVVGSAFEYKYNVVLNMDENYNNDNNHNNDNIIAFGVFYSKNINENQAQAPLTDFASYHVEYIDFNPNIATGIINGLEISVDNNTIDFVIEKNKNPRLENISKTTPIRVLTSYFTGMDTYYDRVPDDGSFK